MFVGQFGQRQESLEKTVSENNKILNEKLDKVLDGINSVDKKASAAHNRIDGLVADEGPIRTMQAELKENRAWKIKSILAMIGISGASGAAASGAEPSKIGEKLLALFAG